MEEKEKGRLMRIKSYIDFINEELHNMSWEEWCKVLGK